MKFGMFIVLDETNRLNIFFKSIEPGVGIRRGPIVLLCFIIGKLYILCVEIRISLSEENFNEE